jgi:hypothetical protein
MSIPCELRNPAEHDVLGSIDQPLKDMQMPIGEAIDPNEVDSSLYEDKDETTDENPSLTEVI